MNNSHLAEIVSYLLGSTVFLVAIGLAARQWVEVRRRSPELPTWERRFFHRQDARRWSGSVLMVLLAVGLVYGNTLPPAHLGKVNPTFLKTWIGVGLALLALLGLALWDWLANRAYSRKILRNLDRERISMLQAEVALRSGRIIKRKTPYDELFGDSPN